MATQMMIYESAVPVSSTKHGGCSVDVGSDYGFSRSINSVPLTAVEIPAAASEYVVIFAGNDEAVLPAVLLGIRDQENLYVTPEGGWKARYVPAFLRRYPFVFSSPDQGKTFTLCIDESFKGLNRDRRGQALFDDQQKPTEYTNGVLKFLQQYQIEFQRTLAFCKKLKDLNLLEPMRAQIALASGERVALTGFMAVDRARVKTLSAEKLAELARTDELELLYAHLLSMRNFAGMRERLAAAPVQATTRTPESAPVSDAAKPETAEPAKPTKSEEKPAAKKR